MASPIEQLLTQINPPALRPLARYDLNKYASGGQHLSNLQFNTAQKAILTGKPVIKHNENHGILSDIMHLPGNLAKDATETAMGFFSPWKWIPSIYHNVESGNIQGLLPLIPGYTTAKNLVHGDFHDILTHPAGTLLDVLPYAHAALPGIGRELYGAEEGAAKEAGSVAEVKTPETTPKTSNTPKTIETGLRTPERVPTLQEIMGIERNPDVLKEKLNLKPELTPKQTRVASAMYEGKPGRALFESLPEKISNPEEGIIGRRLTNLREKVGTNRVMAQANRAFQNSVLTHYIEPLQTIFKDYSPEERKGFTQWWENYNEYTPGEWKDAGGNVHVVPQRFQEDFPKVQEVLKKLEKTADTHLQTVWYHGRQYLYHEDSPVLKARNAIYDLQKKVGNNRVAADEARDALIKQQTEEINPNSYSSVQLRDTGSTVPQETMPTSEAMDAATVAPHLLERTKIEDRPYIDQLKEDIRQNGIQQPIDILNRDGKNIVWDGLHRLIAADELGIKNVPFRMVNEAREVLPSPRISVYDVNPIQRKSHQLFITKDKIAQEESRLDRLHAARDQTTDRLQFAKISNRITKTESKLANLRVQHDLLSRREMLIHNLTRPGNAHFHVSPEDYDLLDLKIKGEGRVSEKYRKALDKLEQSKKDLNKARAVYDKTLARNAPATFYPLIRDTVLKRVVDKFRENHPDFPEGKTEFDPELTRQALAQHTMGRDPVSAGLIDQKELNALTREVESTWQQLADDGLNPQYMSSVPSDRFGSALDPNLFRAGALRDEPYSVKARVRDLTPSGIKDPVVGLTAPALAILRRDSLRQFYSDFLAPSLKTEADLDSWLDREIANSQMKPLGPGESLESRRLAIKKSRWSSFDLDNIDPELAELFPKGQKVYAPKEIYDSVKQLFSPRRNQLESLSSANIQGMRVFRTAVMGLSVKHLAHILFGGMAMLLMRGGLDEISPDMMRAAWHMAKENMPKELSAGVDFYNSHQLGASILPEAERTTLAQKIGSPVAKVFTKIQSFEERISNFERSLSYLSELDRILNGKASPHLSEIENGEVRAALEKGDKEHAIQLAKRGAIKHANKALIDFDGMLPAERGVIRNVFPFYAFTRHIFKYAFTMPIDYPLRASFIYRIGQIVQNDMQNEGLPEQWMRYLTFGPNKEGDVTNLDLRFLNPFRSLPDDATGAGLVNTLNPFLGYALEWAGVNPWTTSAERFPDLRYNPQTGYTETKRRPFSLLGLVSQVIPEAGILGHVTGDQTATGIANQASRYGFLPLLPHADNINLQRATDTLAQFEVAQSVVSKALKTGDTNNLRDWNLVPVPGLDKLVPGKTLAKLIDSLPKSNLPPRRQLGIR